MKSERFGQTKLSQVTNADTRDSRKRATNQFRQVISGDNPLADGLAFSPLMNMALDSWLAEKAPLEPKQSILRIYRWSPAGLSIGRNQLWERALELDALVPGEVAVRRITGGRAIYHDSAELTYSFVTEVSETTPHSQGRERSDDLRDPVVAQRHIAGLIVQSLLRFLRATGIDARAEQRVGYVPAHRPDRRSPHCFVSTARHEITAEGRKIVASAQRALAGRFFQHGSIKLTAGGSHPALYERPLEQPARSGNKSTPVERCIVEGEVAESPLKSTGESPDQLDPSELRTAFRAIFGKRMTPPTISPHQWEEVFRRMADIDSIVGSAELAPEFSVPEGLSRTPIPHSPHSERPHTPPHTKFGAGSQAESIESSGAARATGGGAFDRGIVSGREFQSQSVEQRALKEAQLA